LIDTLLEGMEKKFGPLMDNLEYQLAAAFHPRFRLMWLEKCNPDIVPRVRLAMEDALVDALGDSAAEGNSMEPSIQVEEADPFMAELFQPSGSSGRSRMTSRDSQRSRRSKAQGLLVTWLNGVTMPDFSNETFLHETALIGLFVKYNTPIVA